VLSKIGRVLLHGDHSSGLNKRIVGITFGLVERDALSLIKSLGEIISINDTENSSVHIKVHGDVQIFPCVDFRLLAWDENLVSLKEDALRDATVLNSILKNVQSIIIQIIVNGAFADTIIFVRVLYDRLLEVGLEVQNLL
jgi:hypothetical protein